MAMDTLAAEFCSSIGLNNLEQIERNNPCASNKDVHLLEAEKCFIAGDFAKVFFHLSLTHGIMLNYRLEERIHNLLRGKPSKSDQKTNPISDESLRKLNSFLQSPSVTETVNWMHQLPSDWTLVQLTSRCGPEIALRKASDIPLTPSMFICRSSCGPNATFTVQEVAAPNEEGICGIMKELELISEENQIICKEYQVNKDSKKYKLQREELDSKRLQNVIKSMQVAWLKLMDSLLSGSLINAEDESLLESVIEKVVKETAVTLNANQRALLKCLISRPYGCNEVKDEWSLGAIVKCVIKESVRSQLVKDVAAALKSESKFIERIRKAPRGPVILILDRTLLSVPWEMLTVLQGQPVTRVPSLQVLMLLFEYHRNNEKSIFTHGIDASNGFFILDPQNNLPRTQERLKGHLDRSGWSGLTAEYPKPEVFQRELSTKDVFSYFGHGSGSKYFPGKIVQDTFCRSLVMLFGCSSVRQLPTGRVLDPWGTVLHYFIALCPCIVGMLMPVMDRDTDGLTQIILTALQGKAGKGDLAVPPADLASIVARARRQSIYKITAAALVIYGLPLSVRH